MMPSYQRMTVIIMFKVQSSKFKVINSNMMPSYLRMTVIIMFKVQSSKFKVSS